MGAAADIVEGAAAIDAVLRIARPIEKAGGEAREAVRVAIELGQQKRPAERRQPQRSSSRTWFSFRKRGLNGCLECSQENTPNPV